MKLMYAPQSPFARKVRVAAIELGLDGDIEAKRLGRHDEPGRAVATLRSELAVKGLLDA